MLSASPNATSRALRSITGATELPSYKHHYIAGEWVESTGDGTYAVTDSNTGDKICHVPAGSAADVARATAAAAAAWWDWSERPLGERKDALRAIMSAYKKRVPDVADALCMELGCTRHFSENVQAKLPLLHFGELLEQIDHFKWEEQLPPNTTITKEPIGVVGCITPWNYPVNQIALKVGPALLAGCTVVLKPSEVTPICAYILAEAIDAAGLPPGVFVTVAALEPAPSLRRTCGARWT